MRPRLLIPLLITLCAGAETKNVVLVTADGLRWQEAFTGIDPLLMNEKSAGMEGKTALRDRLWRDSAEERRELLMPFFWGKLAQGATVLDNVRVTNGYRVSYPGYSEILTGRAQDDVIRGNDQKQNPTETVLEYIRRKLGLPRGQVAVFGSWETFRWIVEKTPGSVVLNAGYMDGDQTPRIRELSRMQRDILSPWDSVRHDYFTFEMAMDYLTAVKPRILYIAFGETDDWAHNRRYDRVLESIQYFDRSLERLWNKLETMPEYRGKTALVITGDHGRGSKLEDWSSHGTKVEGAERIWTVVAGPDRDKAGRIETQSEVAPAILRMLKLDPQDYLGGSR
jgi:hypothetical protein